MGGQKDYFEDLEEMAWEVESRQLEQGAVNYNPVGGTNERACANCQFFVSPDKCLVVANWPQPITPNGISDLWRERVIPEWAKERDPRYRRRRGDGNQDEDEMPRQDQGGKEWGDRLGGWLSRFGLGRPREEDHGSGPLRLFKDREGQWWWMAYVTNNFRDQDQPPEIFEEKAHKEFIAAVDQGQAPMPELWYWHTPGTRWGKARHMGYDDGLVWAVGTVDPGMEDVAHKIAQRADSLRVSHGYKEFTYSNRQRGIIDRYRMFEISPLPAERAANPLTGFSISKEAVMKIQGEKRQNLVDVFGEDRISQFEMDGARLSKMARELGLESKDITGDEPEAGATTTGESNPPTDNNPPGEAQPQDGKSVVDALAPHFKQINDQINTGLADLKGSIGQIDERVKALESRAKEVDQGVSEGVDAALATRITSGNRPSENNGNVLTKEEATEYGAPQAPAVDPQFLGSLMR